MKILSATMGSFDIERTFRKLRQKPLAALFDFSHQTKVLTDFIDQFVHKKLLSL